MSLSDCMKEIGSLYRLMLNVFVACIATYSSFCKLSQLRTRLAVHRQQRVQRLLQYVRAMHEIGDS